MEILNSLKKAENGESHNNNFDKMSRISKFSHSTHKNEKSKISFSSNTNKNLSKLTKNKSCENIKEQKKPLKLPLLQKKNLMPTSAYMKLFLQRNFSFQQKIKFIRYVSFSKH